MHTSNTTLMSIGMYGTCIFVMWFLRNYASIACPQMCLLEWEEGRSKVILISHTHHLPLCQSTVDRLLVCSCLMAWYWNTAYCRMVCLTNKNVLQAISLYGVVSILTLSSLLFRSAVRGVVWWLRWWTGAFQKVSYSLKLWLFPHMFSM